MRRLGIRLTLAATAVGLILQLSGIGFAATTIQYWSPWGGIWQQLQEQIIAEFNESQDRIKVEYVHVPGDLYIQRLMTGHLSRQVPDVMAIWGFNALSLVKRGVLMPLDRYVDRDLKRDEFVPAAWDQFTLDGQLWALAYGAGANALIYNKAIFDDVGLAGPPANFDELRDYALKIVEQAPDGTLERLGYLPLDTWGGFLNFSYMFGGDWYDEANQRVTANTPAIREALDWMLDFYERHGGAEAIQVFTSGFGAATQDPFISGKLAMKLSHSWYMVQLAQFGPDVEYGVAPIPIPGEPAPNKWALFGADSLVIPRNAKHPDEGWEFLKWMVTEGQARWAERQAIGSTWIPAVFSWPDTVPPNAMEVYNESLAKARPFPVLPVPNELTDSIENNIDLAVRGLTPPEQALKTIEEEVQEQLERALRAR